MRVGARVTSWGSQGFLPSQLRLSSNYKFNTSPLEEGERERLSVADEASLEPITAEEAQSYRKEHDVRIKGFSGDM
eukprot:CAMPEP_0114484502 /NCGR_PEP_ID=MMETSP0104-20121206/19451_1 /TAXON_ID=37642 ORGANISM="Paraphysomonas imperforata, Strain PA2" /NCGR_SAMPLE_ID=MMETSP0104 /ASSEMBLY_ACC=CAM_ASM_000202 /LENGTH=75 /DNA_ID=CAMNT_0001660561 /DNA_START=1 /DNA_END=225 /DNA_ORIENTATION=-